MMNGGKGAILASLKSKMQSLRDELDGVRDQLGEKCKECENLHVEKNQVTKIYDDSVFTRNGERMEKY